MVQYADWTSSQVYLVVKGPRLIKANSKPYARLSLDPALILFVATLEGHNKPWSNFIVNRLFS